MRKQIAVMLTISMIFCTAVCQNIGSIQINSSENVHFIVADPLGRRTGADPRGVVSDVLHGVTFLREIPGANYVFSGFDKLEADSLAPDSHEFMVSLSMPENNGVYSLQAIGVRLSDFWMTAYVLQDVGLEYKRWNFEVRGAIDKDSVITYRFTYYSAADKQLTFKKVVNASSLIQDVAAMYKLSWITTQSSADKYSDWFRVYGSQHQANNFGVAQATLLLALASLRAENVSSMRVDAASSLRSDTEQLLAELPTVLASMDTLVSVKHRSFSSGWLADANFVKELDNGLDNAKKHLARKDSVNAHKEVQKFQDKVNKEYEKTVDNQKKGKPRDKRFVTVEGWKSLYNNAQYIMDRLPSGKR